MRTGAGLWIGAELRRRWRALVLLTLLCGMVVAVVLAALAGARRTTTAYDRFLAEAGAGHVDVQIFAGLRGRSDVDLGNGTTADDLIAELRRLPEVEALDRGVALQLFPEMLDFYSSVSFDGSVNRPRVLEGRLPRGIDEMALSRSASDVLGKRVGDRLGLHGPDPSQAERLFLEGDTSVLQEQLGGPAVDLRVVGVVEGPGDIGRVDLSGPYGLVTPGFYARHGDDLGQFGPVVSVRLRDGFRDLPAFRAAVRRVAGNSEFVSVEDKRADVDAVNNALDVQALALLLFGIVAGAAGLVGVGIAVTRQQATSAADCSVLSALGLTRRRCAAAVATIAAPVVAGGVVLGVAGAVAASPLLPIGLGERAEPDPGPAFDALVIPLGAAALAFLLAAVVLAGAWRASRSTAAQDRDDAGRAGVGLVNRWISSAGLGAVGATGLRLAFDRGSLPRPAPTRAALTAAVFATAGVTAVLVFGASLANVVARPELSGFPWDAASVGGESLDDVTDTVDAVVADRAVEAVLTAQVSETVLGGTRTQLHGTRPSKGRAGLTVLEGRGPAAPDEVALGPRTLRRLGSRIGDGVELPTEEGGPRRYRVVGTAVFPILNHTDYDNGVWLTSEGLTGVEATAVNAAVLIRMSATADLDAERPELEELGFDFDRSVPAKVSNLDEAEGFPQALAAFLAVLGLVTVGHALASSPRRRRRELAVLRTLGLVRRQVGATLAVQATAVSLVGLVVGLPLGIAAGRTLWGLVVSALSLVRRPVVPASVLLVAAAAVVVANLMAVLPARRAAAVRPGEVLRAE